LITFYNSFTQIQPVHLKCAIFISGTQFSLLVTLNNSKIAANNTNPMSSLALPQLW